MSEHYYSMWADLGLDLEAHDALLGVLGKAYHDIFLAQRIARMAWAISTLS